MTADLAQRVLQRDRRALARLLTRVENDAEGVDDALAFLYPKTGRAHIVGVTGAPGTGKSTLVNALVLAYRQQNKTVAVLAVDPSSPFTGGAILGDRIRMNDLAGDSGVFVRSMAARGSLGGLAGAARDAVRVLDAAGFDVVFVETVGAGQNEVDIVRVAETIVVVEAPGLGDDVQAIKAGILEIADVFVVNKADRPEAHNSVRALRAMLDLSHPVGHHGAAMASADDEATPPDVWMPPVLETVATTNQGIEPLIEQIAAHRASLATNGLQRAHMRIEAELRDRLRTLLLTRWMDIVPGDVLNQTVDQVYRRVLDPRAATRQLLAEGRKQGMKVPGTQYYTEEREATEDYITRRNTIKIFAGSTSHTLVNEIVEYLRDKPGYSNIKAGDYTRTVFANENIFIRLNESVRGQDVYLVQTMCSPVHRNIFEMLIMIDALKRDSAKRINVIFPYMTYARSDKKDQPRVPITARLLANMIEVSGADRYMTVDLHAGQIQGFFNIPGDSLKAFHLLSDYVIEKNVDNLVVAAADLGYAKQGRNWAEKLGTPLAIIEKRRHGNDGKSMALTVIGDVKDKNVLLVDDEVLTGGSVVNAVTRLRENGAKSIYLAFTHPLLADKAIPRLRDLELDEIITTNTIPIPAEKMLPNMTVLSVGPMLSEVIRRAHEGRSVGELFNE